MLGGAGDGAGAFLAPAKVLFGVAKVLPVQPVGAVKVLLPLVGDAARVPVRVVFLVRVLVRVAARVKVLLWVLVKVLRGASRRGATFSQQAQASCTPTCLQDDNLVQVPFRWDGSNEV